MEATITWCFSTPHPALGGPATPGGVTFPSSAHLLACSALTFKGRVPRGMYRSVCFLLTVRVCALWRGGGIGPHVCDDRNCELVNVTILFCEEQIGTFKRVIYIIGTISVHGPRSPKS